ncbi:MAG: 7TM diverse intracellular signaling domain-containing protein [Sulfuricurvum sp.]|uniref:7TM diverse intracellular signaling domain-containing protein n=1 Tax=Sulfuricurvum sp. TaxID=2025608 RepID=UPI0026077644|nr:7TM diverse intracellular signaling domain-containing protein [Sulfuricurvum sp.]MDD2830058.1 7TM diverse intracellular signaling domain-containing protein [Sulfuricurvum sp.]MDD4950634.1 7TM diverse intracellular signaling domain-containing protein [Sulfuricurvum sp.]
MGYIKNVLLLITFLLISPKVYAIPEIDISKLSQPKVLDGSWAFSSGIIYDPSDIRLQNKAIKLPTFIESILGTSQSEATFVLNLKTTPNLPLTLDLKQPFTVWRLLINGEEVASSGIFGLDSTKHQASTKKGLITFTPTDSNTLLMIHVANSQHEHIGFYGVPVIAPQGILEKQHLEIYTFESIITVLFILVGLYHIGLFSAWRKDKATLWFGLMCLAVALRMSTTGEEVFLDIFHNTSWETLLRLQYASGCISLPLFVWYLDSLYPRQTIRLAKLLSVYTGAFFLSLCTLFPTLFFTPFLFPYEIIYLVFIIYTLLSLFKAVKEKEDGSLLAFIAFIMLSLFIMHDFLRFDNLLTNSNDIAPYGFALYVIAQAAVLLKRSAHAFRLIEIHTENLELIVNERTYELTSLVAQRELLLRELTHRVKNNLQFIVGLLWIQRKESNPKTQTVLKTLESQIQSIATVHESLCSQNAVIAIEIHDYLQKLIFSLRNLHSTLTVNLDISEPVYIKTDHTISMGLILNELITNHLKYSNPLDIRPIHIRIKKHINGMAILYYTDGFDHREIFNTTPQAHFGLPKLGWPMIKEFVKQMESEIIIHEGYLEIHFPAYETI